MMKLKISETLISFCQGKICLGPLKGVKKETLSNQFSILLFLALDLKLPAVCGASGQVES